MGYGMGGCLQALGVWGDRRAGEECYPAVCSPVVSFGACLGGAPGMAEPTCWWAQKRSVSPE